MMKASYLIRTCHFHVLLPKLIVNGHPEMSNNHNTDYSQAAASLQELHSQRVTGSGCSYVILYFILIIFRYNGEIGDVVVGRIISVGQHRWKVDTHSKLDSFLMLSSVNLPGGELRRRSEEDERMMRHYLSEGDVISVSIGAFIES